MTADGRARRPTSVDVAREAGVSRATVSYVLNDTPNQKIPEPTRQRVLDAVARLGYTPSAPARALRSGRSGVVLLLLPDWPIGHRIGEFMEQLAACFAAAGLIFVAHPRRGADRPVTDVWQAILPSALLTWTPMSDAERAAVQAVGIPVALSLTTEPSDAGVGGSNRLIGQRQAEHLLERGHRRLGYAGTEDERVSAFSEPRLAGVRAVCAEQGLDEPLVVPVGFDPASASRAVAAWLQAGVTAVCAYNDEVALAVLAGVAAAGRAAPEDLAVIGVDDLPIAAVAVPPLTTVSSDQSIVADYVARAVLAQLAGEREPPPSAQAIRVVVRAST